MAETELLTTVQDWTPDPFLTDVERRADRSMLLKQRGTLAPTSARLLEKLEQWAATAPNRVCVARRNAGREWAAVTYAQALKRVQRIAASLLERNLSASRPIAILSSPRMGQCTFAVVDLISSSSRCPHGSLQPCRSLLPCGGVALSEALP